MSGRRKKTALISVYDKTGIVEFARSLQQDLGYDLLASGGTARALSNAGLRVRDVADLVGPPILGHRVVTLSREVHAGLLARDTPEDLAELAEIGAPFIDLVCIDFYPLSTAIREPDATRESVIEKTDIGGPTMVRSAAKGRRIVACDAEDREWLIEKLMSAEGLSEQDRTDLIAKAEALVSRYCLQSAHFHSGGWYHRMTVDSMLSLAVLQNHHQLPLQFEWGEKIEASPSEDALRG